LNVSVFHGSFLSVSASFFFGSSAFLFCAMAGEENRIAAMTRFNRNDFIRIELIDYNVKFLKAIFKV
jgi:hypothetical protein